MLFLFFLAAASLAAQQPPSCEQGMAAYRKGDYEGAQAALWTCAESGSANDTEALYLAQTYRNLKNCDSGLVRAAQAIKKRPGNQNLLYVTGYICYRCNHTKQSMLLAGQAYRLAPKDWRVHQLFALDYITFGMNEAAKVSLETAISLNSTNAELYYQLARLYFTLGNLGKSIELSGKAIAILPDYPEAHHNLALSYEGLGNMKLAAESFEKAVDLNRKYQRADELPLIDFAVYRRMGGNPEGSLALLREALTINPRSPKANYEMGELLRDLRQYPEARTYLERALELEPCNARAVYGLAVLSRQLGDAPRSVELFRRFRELDSASKDGSKPDKVCSSTSRATR